MARAQSGEQLPPQRQDFGSTDWTSLGKNTLFALAVGAAPALTCALNTRLLRSTGYGSRWLDSVFKRWYPYYHRKVSQSRILDRTMMAVADVYEKYKEVKHVEQSLLPDYTSLLVQDPAPLIANPFERVTAHNKWLEGIQDELPSCPLGLHLLVTDSQVPLDEPTQELTQLYGYCTFRKYLCPYDYLRSKVIRTRPNAFGILDDVVEHPAVYQRLAPTLERLYEESIGGVPDTPLTCYESTQHEAPEHDEGALQRIIDVMQAAVQNPPVTTHPLVAKLAALSYQLSSGSIPQGHTSISSTSSEQPVTARPGEVDSRIDVANIDQKPAIDKPSKAQDYETLLLRIRHQTSSAVPANKALRNVCHIYCQEHKLPYAQTLSAVTKAYFARYPSSRKRTTGGRR